TRGGFPFILHIPLRDLDSQVCMWPELVFRILLVNSQQRVSVAITCIAGDRTEIEGALPVSTGRFPIAQVLVVDACLVHVRAPVESEAFAYGWEYVVTTCLSPTIEPENTGRCASHSAPGTNLRDGVQFIIRREDLRHRVLQSASRNQINHAIPGDESFRVV